MFSQPFVPVCRSNRVDLKESEKKNLEVAEALVTFWFLLTHAMQVVLEYMRIAYSPQLNKGTTFQAILDSFT